MITSQLNNINFYQYLNILWTLHPLIYFPENYKYVCLLCHMLVGELWPQASVWIEELKKYTKNFSDANILGSGGYGQVLSFLTL